MLVESDDAQLTAAIGSGDPRGEEELCRRFMPRVRRKVEAALPGRPDCEDLTSEILQAAIQSLRGGRFRGDSLLSTYIHGIAKNKIAEFLRRKRPETTALTDDIADPRPPPDEEAARSEVRQAVRDALAELKPKYRQVLYLYYYRGFRVAEIGELLGVSPRRISERKEYGLRVLRSRFRAQLIEFR
jgi:RNA polymerase sigma-70 factor (ECF subfamily)